MLQFRHRVCVVVVKWRRFGDIRTVISTQFSDIVGRYHCPSMFVKSYHIPSLCVTVYVRHPDSCVMMSSDDLSQCCCRGPGWH